MLAGEQNDTFLEHHIKSIEDVGIQHLCMD